ncbi:hypothetical protein O0544_11370 [Edwardsiella anguillarum]|nr:hypothetical protein [Edwardsiella anguillarum]
MLTVLPSLWRELVDPQYGLIQVGPVVELKEQITAFLVYKGSAEVDGAVLSDYGQRAPVFDRIKPADIVTVEDSGTVVKGKVDLVTFFGVTVAQDIADNSAAVDDVCTHRTAGLTKVHGDAIATLNGRTAFDTEDTPGSETPVDLNGGALFTDNVGAVDIDIAGDRGASCNQYRGVSGALTTIFLFSVAPLPPMIMVSQISLAGSQSAAQAVL